jgi:hypothetical protein
MGIAGNFIPFFSPPPQPAAPRGPTFMTFFGQLIYPRLEGSPNDAPMQFSFYTQYFQRSDIDVRSEPNPSYEVGFGTIDLAKGGARVCIIFAKQGTGFIRLNQDPGPGLPYDGNLPRFFPTPPIVPPTSVPGLVAPSQRPPTISLPPNYINSMLVYMNPQGGLTSIILNIVTASELQVLLWA